MTQYIVSEQQLLRELLLQGCDFTLARPAGFEIRRGAQCLPASYPLLSRVLQTELRAQYYARGNLFAGPAKQ